MEPAGVEVPIVWRGRRATAFVPALLADRDLCLSARTVERTAAATASLAVAAAAMPADIEPLARLLLRTEGVASSYLEGISAPLADVVLAETAGPDTTGPAAWVAANLAAVDQALAAIDDDLTVELLCAWHATLMAGSPTPQRYIGVTRDEQGWIGGTSPLDAALVTPPPSALPALLADLVAFANRDDVDPVAQVAVAHAQFEVVHPFADGNGRLGRVLVSWLLTRRFALLTPPPVSARLSADRGGYLAGLTLFRLGGLDAWVGWFADAVGGAGEAQRSLVAEVDRLRRAWLARLTLRSDALAWRVLDLLPRHLVLTARLVAARTGATTRAASGALEDLVAAGILLRHVPAGPRSPGRPPARYVSQELLGLAGAT